MILLQKKIRFYVADVNQPVWVLPYIPKYGFRLNFPPVFEKNLN